MSDSLKNDTMTSTSRAQFMVTAITDLKNNKRKSKDIIIGDKTTHYRKVIGRMKSVVSAVGDGKSSSKSLRIGVQDILDIETKGRWWKVGAKWSGHEKQDDALDEDNDQNQTDNKMDVKIDAKQKKLLALAAKQRMNTDLRRSIFCIIMGSDDCQNAFEKLVQTKMLKGKNEREVVRVLVHCCGSEKVYNPYYAHLANRVCEYQPNSKFTFQLTFWDCFKQFDTMKARKAANLAKLLAHLIMNYRMNMNVLKIIDISPNDMPEATIIFLTILFTNIFEGFEDTGQVTALFKKAEPSSEYLAKKANEEPNDDELGAKSDREALKENINIFLLHFLQSSPKNKKKSMFRKNLKAAVKACESGDFDSVFS
jgi:nucleolar MIF4G domain-containing protein 1